MTRTMTGTRPGAAVAVTTTAVGVDMFLYGSLIPLLPSLPAVRGSALISGVLFAVYAISLLAATPFIGVWVDRKGPRTPMLAGLLGVAAVTVLFAVTVEVPGGLGLLLLLLARAAQGVAAAASWTAGLALLAATHAPERRGRVMGIALSSVGLGVLLGPAISGPLADSFGPRAPFVFIAALAAADAVARIVLIKQVPPSRVRTPYRALLRGPRVLLMITLTALGAGVTAFPEAVAPFHLYPLGVGTAGLGLVFAAAGVGGSLAAPVAGMFTDRLGAGRIAAAGTTITAGGMLLAGRESALWSIIGLVVLCMGAQVILAPTLVMIGTLAEHIQPAAYGVAYALYSLAYTAGLALAPIVAGSGTQAAGFPVTTLVAGCVALALTVLLVVRRGR